MNESAVYGEYVSSSPEETLLLGEKIGGLLGPGSIVTLKGTLGAGKTVLAAGIARALGISGQITSPTYTIINEYGNKTPLYHIDAYRLAGDEDFRLAGAEELLYGKGVCIIEWPERLSLLPQDKVFKVEIVIREDGKRKILYKNG
ncbi:MAG: tRNA (adenosine(37)-N6)-threonylcarbamoyltransferase complex ATPase subunit type 1 TsaE [Spirochaetaceae bacterium]|jgi:tRNA threonylcarbamoyladenosine biosynthesis protein TsaE|nr:tRNA (adenosine(37)-N6)-threonylcarbamoyltransferase complex ATPase subunit type 1 TsaE [Spirochaetaceae bacterium]